MCAQIIAARAAVQNRERIASMYGFTELVKCSTPGLLPKSAREARGGPMSKSTISTFQLFALFPTEDSARIYLEKRLWPNGIICPDCKSGERVSALGVCATRKPGFYRCLGCAFDFTIRTNTIFERSKVPLHKWL